MRDADRQWISRLKQQDPFPGFALVDVGDEACRVEIISRGEMAFYQQGERALLLEISAQDGVILQKTIREWDTGRKVTPEERAVVIDRISDALRQLGVAKVRVV